MASYRLEWKTSAQKELRALPKQLIPRVLAAAESLRNNPTPHGVRKLVNSERTYRLRIGEYRLIYTIEADRLIIEVIKVAHRREAYR